MTSWKNQVEEFCGKLVAGPNDAESLRTHEGTVYEYCAKFPLEEDFDDVLKTREDEIQGNWVTDHRDGECFAYFNTQEVEPSR